MSANLDLVRSIYADWERGDFSSVEWMHPEIEFVRRDGPEPGTTTGQAAWHKSSGRWLSVWEDWRVGAEAYRELPGECILVFDHASGRGRMSGLEVGQALRTKGANLFHLRDGKVTRLVLYTDRDRALADLGLEKWAVSEENVDIVRSAWDHREQRALPPCLVTTSHGATSPESGFGTQ
jgi:ketosteroid isomerase-like protein